jgi:hypothetical protein
MNLSSNLSNLFFTHESKDGHIDVLNDIASSRLWNLVAAADKHVAFLIQGVNGDFHENDRLQVASTERMGAAHKNVIGTSAVAENFQDIVNEAVYVNFGHETVKLALADLPGTAEMLAEAKAIVDREAKAIADRAEPSQALNEQVDQYAGAL